MKEAKYKDFMFFRIALFFVISIMIHVWNAFENTLNGVSQGAIELIFSGIITFWIPIIGYFFLEVVVYSQFRESRFIEHEKG